MKQIEKFVKQYFQIGSQEKIQSVIVLLPPGLQPPNLVGW